MALPLAIPIAAGAGMAAAGGIASLYGATRAAPKVNAVKAKETYFGGDKAYQEQEQRRLAQQDQEALMMANQERGLGMQARGLQQDVYGQYARMAAGEGPSVAREMAQQGANVAQQQAQQLASSVRGGGGNVLLAQRAAQRTGASAQMQAAGQAAQLGQQEQLAAMGQMANMAGAIRTGDMQARGISEERAQARNASLMGMNSEILKYDTARSLGDQQAEMMAQQANAGYQDKKADRWMALGQGLMASGANTMGSATGGK